MTNSPSLADIWLEISNFLVVFYLHGLIGAVMGERGVGADEAWVRLEGGE